ncbi:MAG: thioredoxin domain-containing protein [bacterium]|nr:thioredoxin domain-containing protein [bacterium]
MERLFLVYILSLLIGCKQAPEKKEEPVLKQAVKPESVSEQQVAKPEPILKQAEELEGIENPKERPEPPRKQAKIEWLVFEDGLKRAKAENKPLMVHFTADWCSWCKKLEAEAFRNQEVILLSKSLVSVKIDCEKTPELAKKFQVRGLPTILFISPEGNVIHKVIGYRPQDAFLSEMKTALSSFEVW